MEQKKNKKKIDRVIFFFWLVPFCTVILLQVVHTSFFSSQSQKQQEETLISHVSSMQQNFTSQVSSLSYIQHLLQSGDMFNFLTASDSSAQMNILSDIFMCRSLLQTNFYSVIFNHKGEGQIITSDIDSSVASQIYSIYETIDHTKTYITFFPESGSSPNIIYICHFEPIWMRNLATVKKEVIGMCALVSKFNITEYIKYHALSPAISLTLSDQNRSINITDQKTSFDIVSEYTLSIPNTDWKINGVISINKNLFFNQVLFLLLLCESAILIFTLLLFQFVYKKYVSTPINQIAQVLNNYVILNHSISLPEQYTYEFDKIRHCIEYMAKKNSTLARQIFRNQQNMYEVELKNKNFQFYALQAQINPHFLYNTLDCITSLAYLHGIDTIADITYMLSDMFRYSINDDPMAPVSKEIAIIQNYLNILNVRYPNKIRLNLQIDNEILPCKIPRMTLQPLVENSTKHNNISIRKLFIYVKGYKVDGHIRFVILDNGRGMPKERLASLQEALSAGSSSDSEIPSTAHIGICNISSRIKLLYGSEYGISIKSQENKFFKLTIDLPLEGLRTDPSESDPYGI